MLRAGRNKVLHTILSQLVFFFVFLIIIQI
ncbi:hypothetical protein E2C01_073861 [Portunus trituberculatus]|uniref:Uncharacterized protein n=1 Tax=Portunus trituberculatus TaxID=210409 RepID=A0A5B7IES8_PORTR|nr:hypothetical protein [Portunus trituberculatus]